MINEPGFQSPLFFYGIFSVVALLALMPDFFFLGTVVPLLVPDALVVLGRKTPPAAG